METHEIQALLKKYWAGETSLEEERKLTSFFQQEEQDLPEDWRALPAYFKGLADFSYQTPSSDFDLKLEQRLLDTQPKNRGLVVHFQRWATVAAACICLTLGWWFWQQTSSVPTAPQAIDWQQYEPETPEEAFQITRQALGFAAKHLEEGTAKAALEVIRFKELDKPIQ